MFVESYCWLLSDCREERLILNHIIVVTCYIFHRFMIIYWLSMKCCFSELKLSNSICFKKFPNSMEVWFYHVAEFPKSWYSSSLVHSYIFTFWAFLVLLFALLNHNIYVTKEITTKSSHILIICLLSHALSSYTFLSKCWNFVLFGFYDV